MTELLIVGAILLGIIIFVKILCGIASAPFADEEEERYEAYKKKREKKEELEKFSKRYENEKKERV